MTNELMDDLKAYSIVPADFDEKDPRMLPYHFPSFPVVKFAKLMQIYSFNKTLSAIQDVAHRQGYVLLPAVCMHWGRVKKFGQERRAKVGKHNFYMMRLNELTQVEINKLQNYIREMDKDDR